MNLFVQRLLRFSFLIKQRIICRKNRRFVGKVSATLFFFYFLYGPGAPVSFLLLSPFLFWIIASIFLIPYLFPTVVYCTYPHSLSFFISRYLFSFLRSSRIRVILETSFVLSPKNIGFILFYTSDIFLIYLQCLRYRNLVNTEIYS